MADSASPDQFASASPTSITRSEPPQMLSHEQWHPSPCQLHDLGNSIAKWIENLSSMAENVIHHPNTDDYVARRVREAKEAHNLSDLSPVTYLADKTNSLKSIVAQLSEVSIKINQEWRSSAKPPFSAPISPSHSDQFSPMSPSSGAFNIFDRFVRQPTAHDAACRHPHFCTLSRNDYSYVPISGPLSDEELSKFIGHVDGTLGHRGTGKHVCPYGRKCTKGGVENGGSVKTFARNSAFRAHLQKHEKKYRCSLPNCPAKSGFARMDQLRRHEKTVPHQSKYGM